MISHSKKFIHIHIPHTAGTSISCALRKYEDENTSHDSLKKILIGKDSHVFYEYFIFAFIRNTYDRLVGLWSFDINRHPEKLDWSFYKWLTTDCKYLKTQLSYVSVGGQVAATLYNFENLYEDWKTLTNKLDIDVPLGQAVQGVRGPYHKYIDTKTRVLINDIFRDDIGFFNHKFEVL